MLIIHRAWGGDGVRYHIFELGDWRLFVIAWDWSKTHGKQIRTGRVIS
jgi:hypothetical protein